MRLLAGLALVVAGCASEPGFAPDAGVSIALGEAYVSARGCAKCHGDPASGTLAGQDMPQPGTMAFGSNLTSDRDTGLGEWADITIVRAIRAGFDAEEQPLCPPMMHYADMGDLEAQSIVIYLRSLPPVRHPVPASVCPPLKPFVRQDGGAK